MFHFLNCLLLTFAPFFIVYRGTKLSEESALKSCALAGLGYATTQALKAFLMATFLPSVDVSIFNPVQEALKVVVNMVELVGIHYTLQLTPKLSKFSHGDRIITVGLGWALTESLVLYLLPLWLGARGLEFSWEFIEMGVASNINLLMYCGVVGAVWLRSRTNLETAAFPLLLGISVLFLIAPAINMYMLTVLKLANFWCLILRGLIAIIIAVTSRAMVRRYSSLSTVSSSSKKLH